MPQVKGFFINIINSFICTPFAFLILYFTNIIDSVRSIFSIGESLLMSARHLLFGIVFFSASKGSNIDGNTRGIIKIKHFKRKEIIKTKAHLRKDTAFVSTHHLIDIKIKSIRLCQLIQLHIIAHFH